MLASVVESTRAQPSRLSTYDDDPCMLLTSRSMCSRLCAAAVKLVGSCIHFSSLLSALALSLLVKPIAFPAARPGRVHYSLLHACEDRRHPIWDGCEAMYRATISWLVARPHIILSQRLPAGCSVAINTPSCYSAPGVCTFTPP